VWSVPLFGTDSKAFMYYLFIFRGWHTFLGCTSFGWLSIIMEVVMEEYFIVY
jgi:hypothetical protein